MNKKYMDFVPVSTVKTVKSERVETPQAVGEVDELEINEMFEAREVKSQAGVSVGRREPKYGVIEDFKPKFVKTEVEKRPLSKPKTAKEEIAEIKAKKIAKMPVMKKSVAKEKVAEEEKQAEPKKSETEKPETLKIPKNPFVNTERVPKRPLSKNVYQKKIVVAKEEMTGPVTIINKPEKDSRVGLVVTIIITIILGAAAGTVAFLLLPK